MKNRSMALAVLFVLIGFGHTTHAGDLVNLREQSFVLKPNSVDFESRWNRLAYDLEPLFIIYKARAANEVGKFQGCNSDGSRIQFNGSRGVLCATGNIIVNIRLEGSIDYSEESSGNGCTRSASLYLRLDQLHSRPENVMKNIEHGKIHFCHRRVQDRDVIKMSYSVLPGEGRNLFFGLISGQIEGKLNEFGDAFRVYLTE